MWVANEGGRSPARLGRAGRYGTGAGVGVPSGTWDGTWDAWDAKDGTTSELMYVGRGTGKIPRLVSVALAHSQPVTTQYDAPLLRESVELPRLGTTEKMPAQRHFCGGAQT